MVFRIKRLLYDEGFTIAGARRFLREHEGNFEAESASERHAAEGAAQLLSRKMLLDLRDTLRALLTLLEPPVIALKRRLGFGYACRGRSFSAPKRRGVSAPHSAEAALPVGT